MKLAVAGWPLMSRRPDRFPTDLRIASMSCGLQAGSREWRQQQVQLCEVPVYAFNCMLQQLLALEASKAYQRILWSPASACLRWNTGTGM